jgi:hypothetical protein
MGSESGGGGFVTPYTARRVAWFVGVASIALLLAALILYLIDRSQIVLPRSVGVWSVYKGIDIPLNIPVPLLGILIASRRPRNPIGWVYLGASFALGVAIFGQLYAIHVLLVDPGALSGGRVMAWIAGVSKIGVIGVRRPRGVPRLDCRLPCGAGAHAPSDQGSSARSRSKPTSTARSVRFSSQSISSLAKLRVFALSRIDASTRSGPRRSFRGDRCIGSG